MKTIYTNVKRPRLNKWFFTVMGILGICGLIVSIVLAFMSEKDCTKPLLYSLIVIATSIQSLDSFLFNVTVDEDSDSITDSKHKDYALKISKLKGITYKEGKNARLKSLVINDDNDGSLDMRTTKENADHIVAQLVKANPSIEIKHLTDEMSPRQKVWTVAYFVCFLLVFSCLYFPEGKTHEILSIPLLLLIVLGTLGYLKLMKKK